MGGDSRGEARPQEATAVGAGAVGAAMGAAALGTAPTLPETVATPTKRLFRVAIEGEAWVMAENEQEASRRAHNALRSHSELVCCAVYPFLPVDPRMVDDEFLNSEPFNADPGDGRTVQDHLVEIARTKKASKEER
jgi:hypothetical protein